MAGQLIHRGTNKWLLRIYRGEVAGKKKYSSKMFHGTTADARRALATMVRDDSKQVFVAPTRITVDAYLDTWLRGKINLSGVSLASYRGQMQHVRDAVGAISLTNLTKETVQELLVGTMHRAGLSPRSIRYTVRIFRSALEDAIESGLLVRNPCQKLTLPRSIKRAATVLTVDAVQTLLTQTKNPLWRLLLTTGMRPQEAFALQWDDLDLLGKWVSIHRAVITDGASVTSVAQQTKTGTGRRISLPADTVASLQAHRKVQAAIILAAGPGYERSNRVFANRVGGLLDIAKVRRQWKADLKAHGLPPVRLYDTRHTHATQMLAAGFDIAWVAARLGHADISMTTSHYAHVTQESQRDMGERIQAMYQGGQR